MFRIRNPDRFFDSVEDSNPKLEEVSINRIKIRKAIGKYIGQFYRRKYIPFNLEAGSYTSCKEAQEK